MAARRGEAPAWRGVAAGPAGVRDRNRGERGARREPRAKNGKQNEDRMTYFVTEACIRCKFQDCVEVCPVDCFYEGENMLVIHPDECIDCGVCEPECPVEAIVPDTAGNVTKWLEINRKFAETWPNITRKGEVPGDADAHREEAEKYEKYFSDKPGKGT